MRVRLDPPIADWPRPSNDRPIVTGHQQTLFHPGILAKYIAAAIATPISPGLCPGWLVGDKRQPRTEPGANGGYAQVIVDQDVYDPLALDLPARDGDRLTVHRYHLARVLPDVPPACQPPAKVSEIDAALDALDWPADAAISRDALRMAYEKSDEIADTLARQAWRVNDDLMHEVGVQPPQAQFASELLRDESYAWVIDALLRDAKRCASLYNRAVHDFPGAGITPLRVEPFMVEVPLWALRWQRPRQRVFIDLADAQPIFVTEAGEPIKATDTNFAPRALLMTALLRHPNEASLFIHGTGGWAYDRITEQWWRAWQGYDLAPIALATADLHLDFDVPLTQRGERERAVWFRHHVKDNVDRYTQVDPAPAARKRELLAHMDDDRDRKRRRAAFDEIHRINDALCRQHPEVIEEADAALARAETGVQNRRIASRRDWFFGLYPQAKLDDLKAAIESCLAREKCS